MQLSKLLVYFETSPALRLLRSPQAPFILDFLHQQFKRPGRITMLHSELAAALGDYCEQVHESHPDVLRDRPETYLTHWSSSEAGWLRRFIEAGRGEPVYQLTPSTENVCGWLDQVLDQDLGFIATESRLRVVIDTLSDLVEGASDDPRQRLEHLRREQVRISREVERIENAGTVTRYRAAQIRERFSVAASLLKQLQGDFRAVEENFKEITRQIQRRQAVARETRGEILEYALNAEERLKQEDQGVSFYEFVRFILSPAEQERLHQIIERLGGIRELPEQSEGLETVRRMVPLLLAEAEKVMGTNQRLSATLRRLLDDRTVVERQRVAQLLQEIQALAASLAADPPRDAVGLDVETAIEIASPVARTFWSEPSQFERIDLTEHLSDEDRRWEAFRQLARMHRLDWSTMQRQVGELVRRQGSVSLGRLIQEYPPSSGMVEVLGYLQLALDQGHQVYRDQVEEIVLPPSEERRQPVVVTVPLVTFREEQSRRSGKEKGGGMQPGSGYGGTQG